MAKWVVESEETSEKRFAMRHYLSVKRLLSGSAANYRQKEIVTANAIKIIRIYGFPQCRNRKMIKEALENEVNHVHIWKFVLILGHISEVLGKP